VDRRSQRLVGFLDHEIEGQPIPGATQAAIDELFSQPG
jgi:hypothetical protein